MKIPTSRSSSSMTMIAPVRRRVPPSRTKTERTDSSRWATRTCLPGAHHILDPGQLAAQAAGRVVEGELLRAEVAHPGHEQGQSVAHGHQRGGAGRRGEAERARFLDRAQDDRQVGLAAEQAGGPLRQGHQSRAQPPQARG